MSQYTTRAVVQAETVLVEPIVSVAMDGADGYTPGLLPSAVASGPIEVIIPWNVELVEGDKLQLNWDTRPVGVVHTITGPEEADGQDLKLTLPLSAADNNNLGPKTPHVLRYHLDPVYTDVNVLSRPINIYVDRTAPGGGLLGELEIPSIEPDYVVTPDKLDSSGRLVARVPSYGGQYEGDDITLLTSRDNVNWIGGSSENRPIPHNTTTLGRSMLAAMSAQFVTITSCMHHTGTLNPNSQMTNIIVSNPSSAPVQAGPVGLSNKARALCYRIRKSA